MATTTTFVSISDTHNLHRELSLPAADVLLHSGDFTLHGRLSEVADFVAWLISQPHTMKIVIAGNHDLCMDRKGMFVGLSSARAATALKNGEEARALFTSPEARAAGVVLLEETTVVTPGGFIVWGSGISPAIWGGLQVQRGDPSTEFFSRISKEAHVLLTHGPPARTCDAVLRVSDPDYVCKCVGECECAPPGYLYERMHVGSAELGAELVSRHAKGEHTPLAICCGHIHEGFGGALLSGAPEVVVLNAATLDHSYKVAHPPIVFSLSRNAEQLVELKVLSPTFEELVSWANEHPDTDPELQVPASLGGLISRLPERA